MINRRNLLSAFGLLLATPVAGWAQDQLTPTLKETLEKGLKCRRTVEFQFVAQVVALVNAGQLPQAVVLASFNWARRQRDDIPFPYFQSSLRELAKKYGVSL